MTTKQEILISAREQRVQEVMHYQINIDNYTLAIAHIATLEDPSLIEFSTQLSNLLMSEVLEQKKAKVMLAVIEQQLEEA